MLKEKVTIINSMGLHARPSAMLVTVAARYDAEVFFSRGNLRINGKSIMGVMMLAAEKGAEIVVEVNGPDEAEAMKAITDVIASGFGENT